MASALRQLHKARLQPRSSALALSTFSSPVSLASLPTRSVGFRQPRPLFPSPQSPLQQQHHRHRLYSTSTSNNDNLTTSNMAPHNDVEAFHEALRSSKRMLALCGAGLSASSGLPTFRGAGGLWRNYDATSLATMNAFRTDPGLVWLFYGYRRHMCLNADPNPAHYALAALARQNKDFLCLTQNVDNLSQRANHPGDQMRTLHGSLFDIKCSNILCDWIQHDNYDDPFCPALAPASIDFPPDQKNPLLDPYHRIKHITEDEIPKCPSCGRGLQRPGVVWFGENLDYDMLRGVDNWIAQDKLDMMFVIGTSAKVYPAAGYIQKAKQAGARIVVINPDAEAEDELRKLKSTDFAFGQDAAEYLPLLLEPVIGKLPEEQLKRVDGSS